MSQIASIARRDKHVCHLCGWKVSTAEESRDHVRPRVDGGYDKGANYKLAHVVCNTARGALSIDLARAVVADLTRRVGGRPSRGQVVAALHAASAEDSRARAADRSVRPPRPGRDLARARRVGRRRPRAL